MKHNALIATFKENDRRIDAAATAQAAQPAGLTYTEADREVDEALGAQPRQEPPDLFSVYRLQNAAFHNGPYGFGTPENAAFVEGAQWAKERAQGEPRQEPQPVAWMCKTGHGNGWRCDQPPEHLMPFWTPLYDAPQPAPVALTKKKSPTSGMNIAQRILHVGGRNNAAGYVEFGSIQAVEALVRQVLRDLPKPLPGQECEHCDLGSAQPQPAPVALTHDIEAAAKKLAEAFDYPWEHMPEQGRQQMRAHAKDVLEAAGIGARP